MSVRHLRRLALALAMSIALPAAAARPPVYGWVEYVEIQLEGEVARIKAKLDTGARSASLHAIGVEPFRRDGRRYVRFRVPLPGGGESVALELRVRRYVRIKRHEGPPDRRPVVRLPVCIGDEWREIDVNLVDRGSFLYPMLLGRRAIAGIALVDPQRTFLRDPDCRAAPGEG